MIGAKDINRVGMVGALLSLLATTSCGLQAEIIQARHWDLNETIRDTTDEQLLLNLVRLRYDETPYFLQVASITTNFSASASAGVSGTIPEGAGNNVLGLNGGVSYSESPSVTWSIPDSRDFLGRFYAPVGADQLTVLTQAGFDTADIFRVGTAKMNLLRNREFEIKDGEYVPDNYDEFIEALQLIKKLRREGFIDFAYSLMTNYGGVEVPISQIDTRGVAEGVPQSLFYLERNPGKATPYRLLRPLYLRFTKQSDQDPRARRLRELLKLRDDLYQFPITDTASVSPEGILAVDGRLPKIFDPDAKVAHIALNNRSVIEILRFAAAWVEVPQADIDRGLTRKRDIQGTQDVHIHFSASEPSNVWLKIQYRRNWFYIAADDLNSRASFTLLSALFASVVGQVPGSAPLLTLPVK